MGQFLMGFSVEFGPITVQGFLITVAMENYRTLLRGFRSQVEEGTGMSVSQGWRWLVAKTRDSKPFFLAFATVCGVVPGVIGYFVMQVTNSTNPELEAKLRQSARSETLMMGKVNKERLGEYLEELKRKEDTNDRYVAALKGETLTRKPYQRIQPVPNPNDTEVKK